MTTQSEETHTIPQWTVGDRMSKSLQHAGIGVSEMADYLGVARATIANWTSGRTKASKQTLRLWALRTGVPLEWIETGSLKEENPSGGGPEGQSGPDAEGGPNQKCAPRDSNPEPIDYGNGRERRGAKVIPFRPAAAEEVAAA